jgi:DNA-binding FadR family transcriptional regulator
VLPNEANFSARLRVSRTALREAIKVLAAKGLVESRPKTGTRVRPRADWNLLDPDVLAWQFAAGPFTRFIEDLFELRQMIEPQAAAIAARRAGPAEMERIEEAYLGMEVAGNDNDLWIDPTCVSIRRSSGPPAMNCCGRSAPSSRPPWRRASGCRARIGTAHSSLPLHRAILDAIRERNPDAAQAAMHRLLDGAADDVRRALADKRPKASKRAAVRDHKARVGNAA